MSCYSEAEIAEVVIDIIRNNPGIRTSEMISEARRIMEPSGEDLQILQDRNDDKFSQKVRNIKRHDTLTGMIRTVSWLIHCLHVKTELTEFSIFWILVIWVKHLVLLILQR